MEGWVARRKKARQVLCVAKLTKTYSVTVCVFETISSALGADYTNVVSDLGKLLVMIGGLVVLAGLVLMLLGKTNIPLGRLPGDIYYRGKNTTFYFPLATSILLSVALSLVLYVVSRFRR